MHCVLRSVVTSVVVVVFLTNISRNKFCILSLVHDDLFLPPFLSVFFCGLLLNIFLLIYSYYAVSVNSPPQRSAH
jgi:hypothetical protein